MNNYIAVKNSTLYHMRWIASLLFFILATPAFCSDSAYTNQRLKGYKKLFYLLITAHPAVKSPIEQKLLQHYLSGSGTVYLLTDEEFETLKKTVGQQRQQKHELIQQAASAYYTERVRLDDDPEFGFALGTINCVFESSTGNMISFTDVYDFNKKKKGLRSLRSELYTRMFRLIAPRNSKKFIVTYRAPAFSPVGD
ncbi:MAG: hypothetical protein KGZ74_12105 [Chitinophagaceae bacterium]|nr:hypothetical protein [Chitinophagaceae bacterium]